MLHKSLKKSDDKIDGSLLHPELVAELKAEILIMREEIDTHRRETSKNITTILEEMRLSRQNAGDYIDGRFERLSINDISPITKQITNLSKDINEIKAGHNKITEMLEYMKSKPEMPKQHRIIEMPAANQSTPTNPDMKPSPLVKEKEEMPQSTSLNKHVPTEANQQASSLGESCDFLIIGDSILQRIDESQFHRTKKTVCLYKRGGKIDDINSMITKGQLHVKDHLIVHVASNDIANNPHEDNVAQKMNLLINTIKTKFPNVQVAISLTLPRIGNDAFSRSFKKLNQDLRKLARGHNITFINHFKVEENQNAFHTDGIHLSDDGIKTFVKERKDTIFKRTLNRNSMPRMQRPKQLSQQQLQYSNQLPAQKQEAQQLVNPNTHPPQYDPFQYQTAVPSIAMPVQDFTPQAQAVTQAQFWQPIQMVQQTYDQNPIKNYHSVNEQQQQQRSFRTLPMMKFQPTSPNW